MTRPRVISFDDCKGFKDQVLCLTVSGMAYKSHKCIQTYTQPVKNHTSQLEVLLGLSLNLTLASSQRMATTQLYVMIWASMHWCAKVIPICCCSSAFKQTFMCIHWYICSAQQALTIPVSHCSWYLCVNLIPFPILLSLPHSCIPWSIVERHCPFTPTNCLITLALNCHIGLWNLGTSTVWLYCLATTTATHVTYLYPCLQAFPRL